MSETDHGGQHRDDTSEQRDPSDRREPEDTMEVIAASTVRILLGILGLMLLLFAIGQVMGFDAMALLSDALDTPEARWMLVALFAVIMIALSIRGFK